MFPRAFPAFFVLLEMWMVLFVFQSSCTTNFPAPNNLQDESKQNIFSVAFLIPYWYVDLMGWAMYDVFFKPEFISDWALT